jgi:hypothetical protein
MPGITIDESRVVHIFRDAEGHFREDTDANRRVLIEVASRATNFLGTDQPAMTGMQKISPTALKSGCAFAATKSSTAE